jgi:hypothetical protein
MLIIKQGVSISSPIKKKGNRVSFNLDVHIKQLPTSNMGASAAPVVTILSLVRGKRVGRGGRSGESMRQS